MIEVKGKYGQAIAYTDHVEENAYAQLKLLCDQPFTEGSRIRIMPDVHAGAGCVIGFTADLGEMVIPNLVGVDIGCGMLTIELGHKDAVRMDFEQLDQVIRSHVPSGMNAHEQLQETFAQLEALRCYGKLRNPEYLQRSLGTLGGGNHFIEVDEDHEGRLYLVIHTGSRNLGKQVAEIYQAMAVESLSGKNDMQAEKKALIERYRAQGLGAQIQQALKEIETHYAGKAPAVPVQLCYLTGSLREDYLHDMAICQEYARCNRMKIADAIVSRLFGGTLEQYEHFETVHNYIDHTHNLVRKGAVSARKGERLLIPINMRDGSLICVGKGNEEWNCSAPHGAGRLFSRGVARKKFTVDEYQKEMQGIFSTTVTLDTIDESPMAYKPMEEILRHIGPTVDVERIIRPVYNFKAAE